MDTSDESKEVVFRSHGTTGLDRVLDNSSEDTTVKIPMTSADLQRTPTVTAQAPDLRMKSEDIINSTLAYLVKRVKSLEMQIEHQSKSANPSEIS